MKGTNRTQRMLAIFITVLMLTMGLAQAASVNTYSNGQSSVDISLDDPSTYTDSSSGSISLPEGETVNAAAMVVSADSVNYGYAERYDAFSTSYGSFPVSYTHLTLPTSLIV